MRISRIYVLGTRKDARFTRICVASIRHWYPAIPITLIRDHLLGEYNTSDLETFWNVEIFATPVRRFGWGHARLEPLFLPGGERCLIVDSDVVFVGPLLESLEQFDEDFLLEKSTFPEDQIKLYFFDPQQVGRMYAPFRFPGWASNTGQMVATTGILKRDFFAPFMTFEEPRRILRPDVFLCGEQGLLNFVLQQKAQEGVLSIRRTKFMRWPSKMRPADVDVECIKNRAGYPFLMHWAGPKSSNLTESPMSHVLTYFEQVYSQETLRAVRGSLRIRDSNPSRPL